MFYFCVLFLLCVFLGIDFLFQLIIIADLYNFFNEYSLNYTRISDFLLPIFFHFLIKGLVLIFLARVKSLWKCLSWITILTLLFYFLLFILSDNFLIASLFDVLVDLDYLPYFKYWYFHFYVLVCLFALFFLIYVLGVKLRGILARIYAAYFLIGISVFYLSLLLGLFGLLLLLLGELWVFFDYYLSNWRLI